MTSSTMARTSKRAEGHQGLGAELAPGEPDHRTTSSAVGRYVRPRRPGSCRRAPDPPGSTSSTVQAGSRMGSSVRTSSVLCRSVWLASMTSWLAGRRAGVAAGSGEAVMRGQQVVDLSGHPHPGGDQHDQVVADPLEVGDQMRGQHDAHPMLGDGLHQALQELPPGERVEAGDRLVEEEQLGAAWRWPG